MMTRYLMTAAEATSRATEMRAATNELTAADKSTLLRYLVKTSTGFEVIILDDTPRFVVDFANKFFTAVR